MILLISGFLSVAVLLCWLIWWNPDTRQKKFTRELYRDLALAKDHQDAKRIHEEWVAEFRRRWPKR